MKFVKQFLT